MKYWKLIFVLVLIAVVLNAKVSSAAADKQTAELRIGIIGLDTSHVVAFTDVLNDPKNKNHITGGKVVAAFKGGSKDIPSSWDRVEGYTKTLTEKHGVKVVDSIEELCKQVDAVMLESVDGRPHLEQAKPVIKAGKPMFIDKPMAGSLREVLEIFKLARENKVPVFSSSSLRYGKDTQAVRNGSVGKVLNAETASPCSLEPHHSELFWYGIHGVESLFTVMGTGCETVKRGTSTNGTIEVTGTWRGQRTGIYRESFHGKGKTYTGIAKGEKGEAPVGSYDGYAPLVAEAIKFFQTGISPVPEEETIEIFAFMEAAEESKRQNGQPVSIDDILKKSGYNRKSK